MASTLGASCSPMTLPVLLLVLLSASASVYAQSNFCYPSDYQRVSSDCNNGVRQVHYEKVRECEDSLNLKNSHEEPCECTPEDYMPLFQPAEKTDVCTEHYLPDNTCKGDISASKFEVDDLYCEVDRVPCQEEHIRSTYSPCFTALEGTGPNKENSQMVELTEVIYYFDKFCNQYLKGSVKLPPNNYMPCNTQCGPGSFLHHDKCEKCPAGAYSTGGSLRFDRFDILDPAHFETKCEFVNASGVQQCEPWYQEDKALKVGAYDGPNDWLQDECASEGEYACHNNLQSTLTLNVKLVRDGFVRFKYSVNAERGADGLSFFQDISHEPEMPLQSYEFHPRTVQYNLSAGYHSLTWLFSKDKHFTKGQDTAAIYFIEVDGVSFNDHQCTPCPEGYFSGAPGATECTPCPLNTVSGVGATSCEACDRQSYALHIPRTQCKPKPICNTTVDAEMLVGPCDANTNKRRVSWVWMPPHVCAPSASNPLPMDHEVECPPCPSGHEYKTLLNGTKYCEFCPAGTVRDAEDPSAPETCTACTDGNVAIKELSFRNFATASWDSLPEGFTTGCQGQCAAGGWRVSNGMLDSGVQHGASVSVWLRYEVTMEMDGEVSFNYSVQVPQGSEDRGFFFYINEDLTDTVEDEALSSEFRQSGPWPLPAGNHTLMWTWVKMGAADVQDSERAFIHDIMVEGGSRGGATACEEVPEGAQLSETGSFWLPCQPGSFSAGGNDTCHPCPPNTFNEEPFGGSWACQPCGEGTSSNEGATECVIGDSDSADGYCAYSPVSLKSDQAPAGGNETAEGVDGEEDLDPIVIYDLAPLARHRHGLMYGPVFDNPLAGNKTEKLTYFVSVCNRDQTNHSCYNFKGDPLKAYACVANPPTPLDHGRRQTRSLGRRIALSPLGHGPLFKRGFVMSLTGGEECPSEGAERSLNITFVCDPKAGYGSPQAWTTEGRVAAFNPDLPYPQWAKRDGRDIVPIENSETCEYQMVWYSAFACPMCTYGDYDMITVRNCTNNKFLTFRYKEPRLCQPNVDLPLPDDVDCAPCTQVDRVESECADANGKRNITFQYGEMGCDPALPGSIPLPANELAGECVPSLIIISEEVLNGKYVVVIAVGALLAFIVGVVALVTYIKNRRLYSAYSKLMEGERGIELGEEEFDGDSGEGELDEELQGLDEKPNGNSTSCVEEDSRA